MRCLGLRVLLSPRAHGSKAWSTRGCAQGVTSARRGGEEAACHSDAPVTILGANKAVAPAGAMRAMLHRNNRPLLKVALARLAAFILPQRSLDQRNFLRAQTLGGPIEYN